MFNLIRKITKTLTLKKQKQKINSMPKENISVILNKKITGNEMEKIKQGLTPKEMEDKWLIFSENNFIHFHRSWTGFCIYRAEYKKTENNDFVITKLIINRNHRQYKGKDNEYDKKIFEYLLDSLLLKKNVPLPIKISNSTSKINNLS